MILPILILAALPQKWHRASLKECTQEAAREREAMNAEGITGDPPITLGQSDSEGKEYWSMNPCGYADDSKPPHFRPRYTHAVNGKEIEITEREWKRRGGE